MRSLVLIVALLLSSAALAAEPLSLYDGRVSFTLPAGFQRMSDELANKKFSRGERPQYIYSDAKTTTSIAVVVAEAKVTPEELDAFRDFMQSTFTRMIPGAQWLKRDYLTVGKTKWARLELMSNAIDTTIHNIILITVLDGKPLMFNFNSTKEDFPRLEKSLIKSIDSIRIQGKKTP